MRLRTCAKNALASALQLVCHCSGIDRKDLEQMYRNECVGDFFDVLMEGDEDLLEEAIPIEAAAVEKKAACDEVNMVLHQIEQVAAQELNDLANEGQEADQEAPDLAQTQDRDSFLPDGPQLVDLTEWSTTGKAPKQSATQATTNEMPKTLRAALGKENIWASLWQLVVFLRCGESGMDALYLKKAELGRSRSRKLNWQQYLGV